MGSLLAVLSAVLAAPIGVLSVVPGREGAGPVEIAFWRAALSSPLFAGHAAFTRSARLGRRDRLGALLLGGVGLTALYVSYQFALREAGVVLGTALAEAAPLWVLPLARILLGERLSATRLAGCALTFAGLLLLFAEALRGPIGLRPLLAGLLASGIYAAFLVASAALAARQSAARLLAVATAAAALTLAPLVRPGACSPRAWGCIALLAVVCTYGSSLAKTEAMARIGASRVAALGTLEPVLATALGFVVLHEPMTRATLAALALELVGIVLAAR